MLVRLAKRSSLSDLLIRSDEAPWLSLLLLDSRTIVRDASGPRTFTLNLVMT